MANHFRAVIYLVGIAFGTFASAANELVISEYIEGTSNNKAIELCNPSSSAVNLATDNYVLFISFNGGTSTSTIPLSGTVPAGGSFVIANNQASTNILSKANQTSSSLSFNGDDAIVLKVGAAGTVVDSYGQVGVRVDFGTDKTYRKKSCGIRDVVTTDAFNRTVQYDEFAVDTFDGLNSCPSGCGQTVLPIGQPTASPTVASPTALPSAQPTGPPNASPSASPTKSPTSSPTASPTVLSTASPTESVAATDLVISEYIEGTSNNKVIELCNPSSSAVNLTTANYLLQIYFNGATTLGNTIALSGIVPAGGSFVLANNQAASGILLNANQTSSFLNFNGDDAVVLRKSGVSGTVVDSFGQVGNRTDFGTDKTYRKKSCGIRDVVTTDTFNSTDQYDEFAVDTFDGLNSCPSGCGQTVSPIGQPTASPTVASPTALPTAQPTGPPNASPSASPTKSPTSSPTASPTVLSTASPTESVAATDLVISEYIEDILQRCHYSATSIALSGTVPAGGSFVLANNQAASGILLNANQTSSFLNFNGDDAVVLRKSGVSGTVVDSFGQVGNRTDFGTDKTYRKKSCGIRDVVTTDTFNSTDQYDEFAVDTFDGLNICPSGCGQTVSPTGQPTASPTVASPTALPTAQPTGPRMRRLCLPNKSPTSSPTASPTVLSTASPTIYFNGATSATSIALSGTVPAGGSFVLANNQAASGILLNANQTSSFLNFNGDDAVVLRKSGVSGTVVDSFGQVGNRTDFGTDKTYRKKSCGIRDVVTTDAFNRTVQYDEFTTDTIDGLSLCPSGCGQTNSPTESPTTYPTSSPTLSPTTSPTASPTDQPTGSPTAQPTQLSTTAQPTRLPTTSQPTRLPTAQPTRLPTTSQPTRLPTAQPTRLPTTSQPTRLPTAQPTRLPTTSQPTRIPTAQPTGFPTTARPTGFPTTARPTGFPTTAGNWIPHRKANWIPHRKANWVTYYAANWIPHHCKAYSGSHFFSNYFANYLPNFFSNFTSPTTSPLLSNYFALLPFFPNICSNYLPHFFSNICSNYLPHFFSNFCSNYLPDFFSNFISHYFSHGTSNCSAHWFSD
ncbi:endonuclease I [Fragilaria crotonensis]|nr:endonuclease I [Fragilaria crotonensis]